MKTQRHIPEKEVIEKTWSEKLLERMREYARCCRHTYWLIWNT